MFVVSLSCDPGIGRAVAAETGWRYCEVLRKVFPDGERYVRIPEDCSLKGERAVVVQSMYPNQDSMIVEALLAADALKEVTGLEPIAVVPYLAYARQDRAFLQGEAVSVRAVLRALHSAGYGGLVVVDIHKEDSLRHFPGRAVNVLPVNTLANALRDFVEDPIVVSPDKGAARRAEALSKALATEYRIVEKFRDRLTGEIRHRFVPMPEVRGRDVIVVDDIMSTGGTMASVVRFLREQGARKVIVAVSHGPLTEKALTRLTNAGVTKIFSMVTTCYRLEHPLITYLSPVEEVLQAIKEVLGMG